MSSFIVIFMTFRLLYALAFFRISLYISEMMYCNYLHYADCCADVYCHIHDVSAVVCILHVMLKFQTEHFRPAAEQWRFFSKNEMESIQVRQCVEDKMNKC